MARISLDGDFIEFRDGPRGTVELLDIQVNRRRRFQGIGTNLIRQMIEKIGTGHTIYLFTRIENIDAQKFYSKNSFERRAKVSRFYNLTPIDEIGWGDVLFSGDAYLYVRRV